MRYSKKFSFFAKLTILVVICFCVVNIVKLRFDYNELRDREAELSAQKQQYEEKIDQLQSDLNHEMDNDYIMRIAREKLNYYLPDEIIFYNNR